MKRNQITVKFKRGNRHVLGGERPFHSEVSFDYKPHGHSGAAIPMCTYGRDGADQRKQISVLQSTFYRGRAGISF